MLIFLFFGGTNSLTGATISAFALKIIPSFLRGITIFGQSMESYRIILYCILIVIVLNFRPAGLMGEKEFSFAWVRQLFRPRTRLPERKGAGNE